MSELQAEIEPSARLFIRKFYPSITEAGRVAGQQNAASYPQPG